MNRHKEYTRQELYDLVWTTPLGKLAKRYGLSDVGLRKICVKHDIPTPPLGYWAKLNLLRRGDLNVRAEWIANHAPSRFRAVAIATVRLQIPARARC